VVEGCGDSLFFYDVIVDSRQITRMVVCVRKRCRGINQAEVIWGKSVAHFARPRVKGMAFDAILHPDRAHLFPKMLLGIADDLLRHFVGQSVFSFIMDGDASHRDAPLLWIIREDTRQAASAFPAWGSRLCHPFFRASRCVW